MDMARPIVTFLTAGILPVPAVKGGAVESLVETLLRSNEVSCRYRFKVFSIWSEEAHAFSKSFRCADFLFLRPPAFVQALDRALFGIARGLFKKRNVSAYRYLFQRIWYVRSLAKAISRDDFGVLVVENHPSIYLALKLRDNFKRYRGSYCYHLHNEFDEFYGCKKIAQNAASVISISDFIQKSYRRKIGGLGDSQCKILYNCVDCASFEDSSPISKSRELRKTLGIKPSDFVYLFCGRLTPEKGVHELLQAFSNIAESIPNAKLLIVGSAFFGSDISSDFEGKIRDLAKALGERVVFTGYVGHENMPVVYAAADVCCLPSIWEEPACLAVLEGMAAGKPVITTRSGGIPEYTAESAILVNRGLGMEEELSTAMLSLYRNRFVCDDLGRRAKKRACLFDSSDYLDRFSQCIPLGEAAVE